MTAGRGAPQCGSPIGIFFRIFFRISLLPPQAAGGVHHLYLPDDRRLGRGLRQLDAAVLQVSGRAHSHAHSRAHSRATQRRQPPRRRRQSACGSASVDCVRPSAARSCPSTWAGPGPWWRCRSSSGSGARAAHAATKEMMTSLSSRQGCVISLTRRAMQPGSGPRCSAGSPPTPCWPAG